MFLTEARRAMLIVWSTNTLFVCLRVVCDCLFACRVPPLPNWHGQTALSIKMFIILSVSVTVSVSPRSTTAYSMPMFWEVDRLLDTCRHRPTLHMADFNWFFSGGTSAAKGNILVKPKVLLPQVKFWFITYDTFHCWGSEKFGENKVEWAGKAETR